MISQRIHRRCPLRIPLGVAQPLQRTNVNGFGELLSVPTTAYLPFSYAIEESKSISNDDGAEMSDIVGRYLERGDRSREIAHMNETQQVLTEQMNLFSVIQAG